VVGRRQILLGIALSCYLLAVLAARPAPTPGPSVRDFEAYWSAGRIAARGGDAYGRGVWQSERTVAGVDASRDELLPYVGPPYALWVWRGFARFDYPTAAQIWRAVLVLAIAGLAILALIGSALTPRLPPIVAAFAFAFSFGPISSGLALGQVTAIAMLGACAAAIWSRAGRIANVVAATVVALLQPNVALGLAALLRRPRSAFAIAIAAFVVYLAGLPVRGWAWPFAYAEILSAHAKAEQLSAIQLAPAAILYGAGIPAAAAVAGGVVVALFVLAAALVALYTIRDAYVRFACLSALVPFVAGFVHEHDLIVAFPAAMFAAARSRGSLRAVMAIGTLLVAIDWLGMAQRPSGIVQSALLAVAVGCMFAAFGPGEAGDIVAVPVVSLIFVVSAWIAIKHPLAVWPDTLGAFRATYDASPAAVWRAELVRNALFAVAPATAWLRSLSLAGCALLAAGLWWQARLNVDVHEVVERRPCVGLEPG
jgi:hypothetical protein